MDKISLVGFLVRGPRPILVSTNLHFESYYLAQLNHIPVIDPHVMYWPPFVSNVVTLLISSLGSLGRRLDFSLSLAPA